MLLSVEKVKYIYSDFTEVELRSEVDFHNKTLMPARKRRPDKVGKQDGKKSD